MTTPADPNVSGQPVDPNAAEQYASPDRNSTADTKAPVYPQAPGTKDPETPTNSPADEVDPEPGGATHFVPANEPDEPGLTGNPAQGGGVGNAAPGTLPSGGDNIETPYNRTGIKGGSDRVPGTGVDPEIQGVGGEGGSPKPTPAVPAVTPDPEIGNGQG